MAKVKQYYTDLTEKSVDDILSKYVINEISDNDGWKNIKSSLIKQIGSNSIPKIIVKELKPNNVLRIHHEHDGRDLELSYAEKVVDYITTLWGGVVRLDTVIEHEPFEI